MASFEVWTLISSHIILKTKETSIFFYGTERSIVIFNWILFTFEDLLKGLSRFGNNTPSQGVERKRFCGY